MAHRGRDPSFSNGIRSGIEGGYHAAAKVRDDEGVIASTRGAFAPWRTLQHA